jgi:hypothetical protein
MTAFDFLIGLCEGALLLFLLLSLIFIFVSKRAWFRLVPAALLVCSAFLALVPETGWSDVRSHWHGSAAMVPYSLLYVVLAIWLRRGGSAFHRVFALISFLAGTSMLALAICALAESWFFYHKILP